MAGLCMTFFAELTNTMVEKTGGSKSAQDILKLKELEILSPYLYEFLKPFNFNTSSSSEIIAALESESGKQFFSTTHRLIKDRDFLIIEKFFLLLKYLNHYLESKINCYQ